MVDAIGLTYCLGLAAGMIGISAWFSNKAYRIAAKVRKMLTFGLWKGRRLFLMLLLLFCICTRSMD